MALPGYELLHSSIKLHLRDRVDALVSVIHWSFIYSGCRLIGVGEKPEDVLDTEQLPVGWQGDGIFVLHYVSKKGKSHSNYLLKIIPIDSSLLLHLKRKVAQALVHCQRYALRQMFNYYYYYNGTDGADILSVGVVFQTEQKEGSEKVETLELNVEEFTTGDLSSVDTGFKSVDKLNNILSSVFARSASDGCQHSDPPSSNPAKPKSESGNPSSEDDLRTRPSRHQMLPPSGVEFDESVDPFAVGGADLNPLGRGGGMLMDPRYSGGPRFGSESRGGVFGGPFHDGVFGGPFHCDGGVRPGVLPRGAVPPGARYDHFGPPGVYPRPDPDHERPPPAGSEDMFM